MKNHNETIPNQSDQQATEKRFMPVQKVTTRIFNLTPHLSMLPKGTINRDSPQKRKGGNSIFRYKLLVSILSLLPQPNHEEPEVGNGQRMVTRQTIKELGYILLGLIGWSAIVYLLFEAFVS